MQVKTDRAPPTLAITLPMNRLPKFMITHLEGDSLARQSFDEDLHIAKLYGANAPVPQRVR
jgi:hypothetical protein